MLFGTFYLGLCDNLKQKRMTLINEITMAEAERPSFIHSTFFISDSAFIASKFSKFHIKFSIRQDNSFEEKKISS